MIFREAEDRDLIVRSRQGDVDAFNVLVSRWERRVFTYLVRNTGELLRLGGGSRESLGKYHEEAIDAVAAYRDLHDGRVTGRAVVVP